MSSCRIPSTTVKSRFQLSLPDVLQQEYGRRSVLGTTVCYWHHGTFSTKYLERLVEYLLVGPKPVWKSAYAFVVVLESVVC
jgi:hypothetical protein